MYLKNIFILLISITLLSASAYSQGWREKDQKEIDSLQRIINNPNLPDSSKLRARYNYGDITMLFRIGYWDSLVNDCEIVLQPIKNEKNREPYLHILSASIGNLGYLYTNKGETNKAISCYIRGVEIDSLIHNPQGEGVGMVNIGYTYYRLGDIEKAIKYYDKARIKFESIDDKIGLSEVLNNLGTVFDTQGDLKKAYEYYNKGLTLSKEVKNKRGMAIGYSNVGRMLQNSKEYKKAISSYQNAKAIQLEIGDLQGLGNTFLSLGTVYRDSEKFDSSIHFLNEALFIFEKADIKLEIEKCYHFLALTYYKTHKYQKALQFGEKAFELANELGYPEQIRNSSEVLSYIYEKLGQPQKSTNMLRVFVTMNDSIINLNTQSASMRQQAKYEYEKQKVIDDVESSKKIAVERKEKEKQEVFTYAAVGGAGLISVFLIFVFNRLKVTRLQKHIIQETNEELNQTNEELAAQRDQIEEQRDNIISSIEYAKRIQDALLKNEEHQNENLPPHFILFQPKDIVSGDFYWAMEKQNHLYVAAVDCTGHGVPGAFLTMLGTSFLNEINSTSQTLSPAEILNALREKIIKELSHDGNTKDGMDLSLVRIDLKSWKCEWSGANNPIYILKSNEIDIIKGDRQPIGFVADPKPFTNHQFQLEPGNQIYLFTDGYPDQFGGEKGKKFGYKNFRDKLLEISSLEMTSQKQSLSTFFHEWKQGEEQTDDVCVIGLKI